MLVSADDIKATLEYLVPGFIALKVFYLIGLRTRRSDFDWTVLSVATAAGLNFVVATLVGVTDPTYRVLGATVLGVAVALAGAYGWREYGAQRWNYLFNRQAWDATFSGRNWVQVFVKNGPIVLGWPKVVSESADTDDQDVFLVEPSFVDRESNDETPIPTVRGMWIPASQIEMIEVIRGPKDPPPAS